MTQPLVARHTTSRSPPPPRVRKANLRAPSEGARFAIKRATDDEHARTEDAFAPFDLARPSHYAAFLRAHAMALPALELSVSARGWSAWQPRFMLLSDDLAALDVGLPAPMICSTPSEPGAWGIQYVLEGSRLGGRILLQRLPADAPRRYLSPLPPGAGDWKAFCAAFDAQARAHGETWIEEATAAAVETFRQFRKAAATAADDIDLSSGVPA